MRAQETLGPRRLRLTAAGVAVAVVVLTAAPAMGDIIGTADRDSIRGGPGHNWIEGRAGNDRIWGQGGSDFIHGNSGNDRLSGGPNLDFLNGEETTGSTSAAAVITEWAWVAATCSGAALATTGRSRGSGS
jgi:hypothetical protein